MLSCNDGEFKINNNHTRFYAEQLNKFLGREFFRMRKVKSSVLRTEQMREQFHQFDSAHPDVWNLFFQFAWEKIDLGYQHYGAKAVMERVRWESDAGGKKIKTLSVSDVSSV